MSFSPPFIIANKNSTTTSSITGTTTRTALGSFTIKGGSMGANDVLGVQFLVGITTSANNKTLEIEFGSTNFFSLTGSGSSGRSGMKYVINRNSLTSQVSGRLVSDNDYAVQSTAMVTMSENTANDITVTFYGTLTNTGETISLEAFSPFLMKGPQ